MFLNLNLNYKKKLFEGKHAKKNEKFFNKNEIFQFLFSSLFIIKYNNIFNKKYYILNHIFFLLRKQYLIIF